ncbi:MAG: non-homologous end-joining DNA ligase [Bacillota bacterium]|jgi:bifunctional non-homologous end joining protein LigD
MKNYLPVDGFEVPVANLEKVFWPGEGITKGDVVQYYIRIWPWLQPHLAGRPLSLVRYPDGITGKFFYQKNFPDPPPWVETLPVNRGRRTVHYVLGNNLATLIWSVNLGCIEVHPWLSQATDLEHPGYIIFDLDPMPPAGFDAAIPVAQAIQTLTRQLSLETFPKISGATGIHIYLPLKPVYTFAQTGTFVKRLGEIIIKALPNQATNERRIALRAGKVYLDHLQNIQGKTIASVYSLRPFAGAPVSMPCTWEELPRLRPDSFSLHNAMTRLKQTGDLFQGLLRLKQILPEELLV